MSNRMEFNQEIAEKCGIREAVVATFLWDRIARDDEPLYHHGRLWTRISQPMITSAMPFITISMVRGSLAKLKKKGIIKSGVFNVNRFDHTNWYAFTDFGEEMMEQGGFA